MAEFDTSVRFKDSKTFTVESSKSFEEICEAVGDSSTWSPTGAKEMGDGGNGEFWLNYSTSFYTRYIKVNVDRPQEESDGGDRHSYNVTISSAQTMSRLSEVFLCAFVLLFAWGLSKLFSLDGRMTIWYVLTFFSVLCIAGILGGAAVKSAWSVPACTMLEKNIKDKSNKD
jgi:hypothetical protein